MLSQCIRVLFLVTSFQRAIANHLEHECNCSRRLSQEVAQLSELVQLHTEKLSHLVKYERQTDRLTDWYNQIHRQFNGILERDQMDLRNGELIETFIRQQVYNVTDSALELVFHSRDRLDNASAEFQMLMSHVGEKIGQLDQLLLRRPDEQQRAFHENHTLASQINSTTKKLKEMDVLMRQMSLLLTKLNLEQRLKQLESKMSSVDGQLFGQWSEFLHKLHMNENLWNTGTGEASLLDVISLLVTKMESYEPSESIPLPDVQDFVAPFNDLPGARLLRDF